MMRLVFSAVALLAFLAPSSAALAQTRPLPPGEIRANGDITFGNALKLGKRQGNKTVITPDTLQILGEGSTGDSSSFSVKADGVGDAQLLAQWMGDLKSGQQLQGILRSQIGQVSIPTTVNRFTVAGCTAAGDGGSGSSYARGSSSGPMAVKDARGGWWELARVGVLDAGAYCLDLTGASDNAARLQAAVTQSIAWGAKLLLPPGLIRLNTTVTATVANSNYENIGRFEIAGQGRGLTEIVWGGSATGCALKFQGGDGYNGHANASVSDLMVGGSGAGGRGICVDRLAHLSFREVFVQGLTYGYYLTDTLTAQWFGGKTTFNNFGLYAALNSASGPNAFNFFGHSFGQNAENAIELISGSTLNFSGGTIEGNGLGGTGAKRGGIYLTNPGPYGPVAATFTGTYFEGNGGAADIYLTAGSNPATLNVFGSHCNRVDTHFATNCIRIDGPPGAAPIVVNVGGTGFRGFNTYVASSARPYIASTSGGPVTLNDAGAYYDAPAETPTIPTSRVLARARFDGTGANGTITPIAASGVASIEKSSAGTYTVTLAKGTASANKTVLVYPSFPVMVHAFGETTTQASFRLIDQNGSLRDVSSISVVVYDN